MIHDPFWSPSPFPAAGRRSHHPDIAGCGGAPASSQASATPTRAPTATAAATYAHLLTPHYPVTMRSDVAYGSAPLEQLDLCQPDGVTSSQLPGIVLIHGGSSTVGDKRAEFDVQGDTLVDLCMSLASQGFVVASINYRLAHANPWPAPVEDAQLAVRWLRAHAHELGMDARASLLGWAILWRLSGGDSRRIHEDAVG